MFIDVAIRLLVFIKVVHRLIGALRSYGLGGIATTIMPPISLALGILIAFVLVGCATAPWTRLLNEDEQFGPTHFLMMGLNPETRGVYYHTDVDFSQSFEDQESRTRGDIEVVAHRVADYGPIGLVGLLGDKLMTNFNDGTFAWGQEGHFF